ncbi:MAG: fasciclin domain-containing protein [Actinomycetota bacterium]
MKRSRMLRLATGVALVAVAALALGACSSDDSDNSSSTTTMAPDTTMAPAAENIVETAAANEDFSTLVSAVQAAGLAETLSGPGPFTVFAPTNEAFAKLPAGTVENLLKPENKDQLSGILTYHVVAGNVLAADVKPGKVKTVNGAEFTVSVEDGKVFITGGTPENKVEVVTTDIETSNGTVHVLDGVLLPPAAG